MCKNCKKNRYIKKSINTGVKFSVPFFSSFFDKLVVFFVPLKLDRKSAISKISKFRGKQYIYNDGKQDLKEIKFVSLIGCLKHC